MKALDNLALFIASLAALTLIIGLGQPNIELRFWSVVACIILVFLTIMVFAVSNEQKYDKIPTKKEMVLEFTIVYIAPISKAEKTSIIKNYRRAISLLEFLAKKDIKYKVYVRRTERDKEPNTSTDI